MIIVKCKNNFYQYFRNNDQINGMAKKRNRNTIGRQFSHLAFWPATRFTLQK